MIIFLNGHTRIVPAGTTLGRLLMTEAPQVLQNDVLVNDSPVTVTDSDSVVLSEGDKITLLIKTDNNENN